MEKEVFVIKKTMTSDKGKKIHIFMTDGHSEVLELSKKVDADRLAAVMNENTDNGCVYEVISIGKS